MSERTIEDITEELLALRQTVRDFSSEIVQLREENENLTRDLENTQILLSVCVDTLKRHGIAICKK